MIIHATFPCLKSYLSWSWIWTWLLSSTSASALPHAFWIQLKCSMPMVFPKKRKAAQKTQESWATSTGRGFGTLASSLVSSPLISSALIPSVSRHGSKMGCGGMLKIQVLDCLPKSGISSKKQGHRTFLQPIWNAVFGFNCSLGCVTSGRCSV